MIRITIFAFLIVLLYVACKDSRQANKKQIITPDTSGYQPVRERVKKEAPISVGELKRMDFIEVSSGSATMEWIYNKKYCVPEDNGFFGYYYLINKAKPLKGSFGLLIVYANEKHLDWSDPKANERFVEITLETSEVTLWDSIQVGMPYTALTKMIGEDGWSAKGTSHFKQLGIYNAEFIVIDSLVDQIRVGRYCQ